MGFKTFEYKMKVRETFLDSFGHVNNARYLEMFEEARWDLISDRGFSLADIQSKQMGPIVLEVQLKFSKELKARELITIKTTCLEYNGKIGKLEQEIIRATDSGGPLVCASATIKFGLFDMKARKLLAPTTDWLNAIGAD